MALMTCTIMHLTPKSPLGPVADNVNLLSPEAQRNMAKLCAAPYGDDCSKFSNGAYAMSDSGSSTSSKTFVTCRRRQ